PAPAPAPAGAPAAGELPDGPARSIEVGGFLGLDHFGDQIELGNSWAPEQIPGTSFLLGARAAFIFLPDLARGSSLDPQLGVEAEAKLAFSSTGSSDEGGRKSYFAPVLGWRAHLIARLRSRSAWTPHLVVGVGGETIMTSSPFVSGDTDAAFYYGPGVTRPIFGHRGRWDLRVDLRHGITAGRGSGAVSTFELQAGLSTAWGLGHRAARPAADSDRDGDGILDRVDACPLQPETKNGYQDDDGCPDVGDRDGDGIADPDDHCPDEPETVNGIDDHDGCPEVDEDGDGLVGSQDACSKEPEDKDGFQDDDGCPDPDNDRDGVLDTDDRCPNDPETRNGYEDDDGCPDEIPPVVQEFNGAIEGITFATARATIRPASKPTLDKAVQILSEHPSVLIRIEGHTDDRGKRDRNLALSLERADAVRQYLVAKGISPERMLTVGHGPDVPRDTNKTPSGRARNRRIEVHILVEAPPILRAVEPPPPPATQPMPPTPGNIPDVMPAPPPGTPPEPPPGLH
ncbi:MAG TPA: OmpA family protein, partial [Kofleriaceae bacterium]|nr:OmpA family protein [Kofleriaceae bacterium]